MIIIPKKYLKMCYYILIYFSEFNNVAKPTVDAEVKVNSYPVDFVKTKLGNTEHQILRMERKV